MTNSWLIRSVIFLVGWMALPALQTFGQEQGVEKMVIANMEEIVNGLDEEQMEKAGDDLSRYLQELVENPVNINSAGIEDLLRIPNMSFGTAQAIMAYRDDGNVFESTDELLLISGIGEKTLKGMKPFISVGNGWELNRKLYSNRKYWTQGGKVQVFSRFQRNLETSEGYRKAVEDGGFVGSPIKYYQRFGYGSRHLSWNLTQEKDAGEQLVDPLHFDHQSWHFSIRDVGKLKQAVVGDYSLSIGEGLVIGSGMSFGKSHAKYGGGIRPYSSAGESNYYSGAAFTFGGRLQFSGFYSNRPLSATVLDSLSTRLPSETGYKRTISEYRREGTNSQKLVGGRSQLSFSNALIGFTAYRTTFERTIKPNEREYAKYDFSGDGQSSVGLDYRYYLNATTFSGEFARTANGGMGMISSIMSSIGENTEINLIYRNYQKDFQSILAGGFSEASGNPQNEQGLYFGINHSIGGKVDISGYVDQYYFPHARYGTHQSTEGYEWMGKVGARLTDQLDVYFQYRGENRDDEYETSDVYGRSRRVLGQSVKSSYRANLEYRLDRNIRLRSRAELIYNRKAGGEPEFGYMVYQDLRLQIRKNLRLDLRITMFDTDSYAIRMYQFENDLLYVFSSRMLYNQGQRMYVLLNYEPNRYIEFWGKFGITSWENTQVIGSGLNRINGNIKRDIGMQMRIKY